MYKYKCLAYNMTRSFQEKYANNNMDRLRARDEAMGTGDSVLPESKPEVSPKEVDRYRVPDEAPPLPEAQTPEQRARSEKIAEDSLEAMRAALRDVAEGREPKKKLQSTITDSMKAPGE